MLLIEQNLSVALRLRSRALVMSGGSIVFDGQSSALLADRAFLNTHLGI